MPAAHDGYCWPDLYVLEIQLGEVKQDAGNSHMKEISNLLPKA